MKFNKLIGIILLTVAATALAAGLPSQLGTAQESSTSTPASKPVQSETIGSAPQVDHPSRINGINVAEDKDGLNIEISGDSSMTAKVMKLNHPDRIVLDIPSSVLVGRARQIAVNNGDVRDVRVAEFQSTPPTTRVVVDLAAMHEFEILPSGKMLVLKLRDVGTVSRGASAQKQKIAGQLPTPIVPAATKATLAEVTPTVASKTPEDAEDRITVSLLTTPSAPAVSASASDKKYDKKEGGPAQTKSDLAAAHFVKPSAPVLVSANQPPHPGTASLAAEPAAVNAALLQQQQSTAPVPATTSTSCASGHYSGAPLNLDLKDLDIKDFFRLVHEISGLNVVLDPGVRGIVTIDVTDIPWDQALAIVLRNNGLECELEGNVLRIATLETLRAEAEARRAQQDAQALAVPKQNYTRYLSYAHSKDVVAIVKKFLSSRGDVVSDDRSNAVIIEDIPATLPKIDALLTALDRKTPEVEIEARVVSATRNFARDIGTQIGFGWGNTPSAIGGVAANPSPINVATNGTPSYILLPASGGGTGNSIPLFSNLPATNPTSGISLTTETLGYRLDFVLSMAESRGLVKVLSRPRVITQNNIAALIRQGQRIPVVTLAQLGGPPTVTYVDAFLRLTVTPQITNENTIFLLLDVENTTADFSHVTGQQLNPTLDTQQTTTQVLVSDGQTVVIGGVIQTTNNLAINQVPLLGSIPILGNLFKHTSINNTTAELLFFITPKIIQT